MEFENAHQLLMDQHLSVRTGERRGRLARGHQYAEKLFLQNVWWPLFGNLDHLHPEYEDRDTFLNGLGWRIIHFSFDDVQNRPEICRMLLQMIIAPSLIRVPSGQSLSPQDKEIVKLAWSLDKGLRPKDVMLQHHLNFRTARKRLQELVRKGLLRPVMQNSYICYYEPVQGVPDMFL